MHLSPALKRSSLAQRAFVPVPKVFISSTINAFIFYLEGSLENPEKEQKLGKKSFHKTSFQLGMGLKTFPRPPKKQKLRKKVSVKLHSTRDEAKKRTERRPRSNNATIPPYICYILLQISIVDLWMTLSTWEAGRPKMLLREKLCEKDHLVQSTIQ